MTNKDVSELPLPSYAPTSERNDRKLSKQREGVHSWSLASPQQSNYTKWIPFPDFIVSPHEPICELATFRVLETVFINHPFPDETPRNPERRDLQKVHGIASALSSAQNSYLKD